MLTIDTLAQEIRRVDGSHSLGAGALAEALMPFLSAALSIEQTQPVKVKALEWLSDDLGWPRTAVSAVGIYGIWANFELVTPPKSTVKRFTSMEAAKAAAQSDYETRVLSAIEGSGR